MDKALFLRLHSVQFTLFTTIVFCKKQENDDNLNLFMELEVETIKLEKKYENLELKHEKLLYLLLIWKNGDLSKLDDKTSRENVELIFIF